MSFTSKYNQQSGHSFGRSTTFVTTTRLAAILSPDAPKLIPIPTQPAPALGTTKSQFLTVEPAPKNTDEGLLLAFKKLHEKEENIILLNSLYEKRMILAWAQKKSMGVKEIPSGSRQLLLEKILKMFEEQKKDPGPFAQALIWYLLHAKQDGCRAAEFSECIRPVPHEEEVLAMTKVMLERYDKK